LVIENLSFVIWEGDWENFAENAQFPGIALQRGEPQPNPESRRDLPQEGAKGAERRAATKGNEPRISQI
jgi:hypothetical protein